EKGSMTVLTVSSLAMGILSIVVALAFNGVESALDAWWAMASIFSGGIVGLFLLGYMSKKVREMDALIAVIIGVIVIAWMSLSPVFFTDGFWSEFRSPLPANLTIVFGTTVIFLTGFLLSRLFNYR